MIDFELPDGVRGFEPYEASSVVRDFVCAVCWSSLIAIQANNDRMFIVVCPEHGNVELCGRVTKNTVSIEMERGLRKYHEVIRNLSDLWGHLVVKGFEYKSGLRIAREYVCEKCGRTLYPELIPGVADYINIVCPTHGNINQCGYVKKEMYHADQRPH